MSRYVVAEWRLATESPGAALVCRRAGYYRDAVSTLAEVDLRGLAGVELQHGGHLWVSGLKVCEEAAHRGVRASEAVAADQGAVDGGALWMPNWPL